MWNNFWNNHLWECKIHKGLWVIKSDWLLFCCLKTRRPPKFSWCPLLTVHPSNANFSSVQFAWRKKTKTSWKPYQKDPGICDIVVHILTAYVLIDPMIPLKLRMYYNDLLSTNNFMSSAKCIQMPQVFCWVLSILTMFPSFFNQTGADKKSSPSRAALDSSRSNKRSAFRASASVTPGPRKRCSRRCKRCMAFTCS